MKFFFIILYSTSVFAWVKPESFDSGYINLEEKIISHSFRGSLKSAKSHLDLSIVSQILRDEKNIINDDFHIPKYFKSSVEFWFSVYTQYDSDQVIIHDNEELSVVYNILDFQDIRKSNINKYSKSNLQTSLTLEYIRKIKKILKELSVADYTKLNSSQYDVLRAIRRSGLKVPSSNKEKKNFFANLSSRLRSQTGQRNKVFQGVLRSTPYYQFLIEQTKNFHLPKEVLAVAFLESSFNINAVSKVDAVGIWQFMKYTANLIMPRVEKNIDYRKNPIISSVSALHLIKENKQILKRWDLAITAYNSGTRNLINARKKFGKTMPLEYILENFDHASIGFASKNFYAEFLALVHTLAYKEIIFPLKGHSELVNKFGDPKSIDIYVSKCNIYSKSFIDIMSKTSPFISELNAHLPKKRSILIKRGSLLVSNRPLTTRKYLKLDNNQIRSVFPKKYVNYISRNRCNN